MAIIRKPPAKIIQQGSIYFWKYKTDGWLGSEWHFTADPAGCDFLVQCFERLLQSEFPCELVIHLTPVSQKILRIPDYNSPFKNMDELQFSYRPAGSSYYEWTIVDNKSRVDITMGKAMLAEWKRAVLAVKNGNGDFSIGLNEDHTIFMWRMPL
ncbi:hypothetical protein F9K33_16110 [bacterium]|nr:MAG: hypothetical protein F9K33_16110 [bacterium]